MTRNLQREAGNRGKKVTHAHFLVGSIDCCFVAHMNFGQ